MSDFLLVYQGTLIIMTPLLLASMGGLVTLKAGSLNIGLEGLLLTGAFSAIVFTQLTGSPIASVGIGLLFCLLLSALMGYFILALGANLYVAGLAINLLARGVTALLSLSLFKHKGLISMGINGQGGSEENLVPFFFQESFFPYVVGVILLGMAILLYRTPFGLRLRAAESTPESLVVLGRNPQYYQLSAYLLSGLVCGLGGSFLAFSAGAYTPHMTAGRGGLALALIFLGNCRPGGILIATFLFSLVDQLSNLTQGMAKLPVDLLLASPYLVALTGTIINAAIKRRKAVAK